MKYHYSNYQKILFITSYFWFKLRILYDVKNPKFKMFFYEIKYTFSNILRHIIWKFEPDYIYNISYIETIFWKFYLRINTEDSLMCSPAFERRDVDYLLNLIKKNSTSKILFIDIWWDIGTYSVIVWNFCQKNNIDIDIMTFEPNKSSFSLLEKNITLNNLDSLVKTYNFWLSSEDWNIDLFTDRWSPWSSSRSLSNIWSTDIEKSSIQCVMLDNYIDKITKYDTIFMKLDIEWYETVALKGAKDILALNKDIFILIEDFIDKSIVSCLESSKFSFITKLTDYNSFWKKTI